MFELLLLLCVAKILQSELQFCEQMCMPSFSFLFGSLATSPRKKWCGLMYLRTYSFNHHLLGPSVSELGDARGGIIHG